jgi:transposase-like protein
MRVAKERDYILDKPTTFGSFTPMKVNDRSGDAVNLVTLAQKYSDPDTAREFLESLLWPEGPVCPHCKNTTDKPIYKLTPKATSTRPARKGLYKCGACRKQFTVTVGTIFEDSHIPIGKWLMAIFLLCSSKKGISSHQLHRMLDITYKSAWFMTHRIRYAMGEGPLAKLLEGTIEVDETFVGGKGDRKTQQDRKTTVIALIQRGGKARARTIATVSQKNLRYELRECSKDAVINTDQWSGYRGLGTIYKRHDVVNHSALEYARKNADGSVAHVNTCESFFSLLKRGIVGSFHHVSREHLNRYADEFTFRWNNRGIADGERMEVAIEQAVGKRLTYKECI